MAPLQETRSLLAAAAPHIVRSTTTVLVRRALTVNDTQKVTLGVIAAYTVAIALLWNIPYVRWSLWPFKVLPFRFPSTPFRANHPD
jgi:hypothetical protein